MTFDAIIYTNNNRVVIFLKKHIEANQQIKTELKVFFKVAQKFNLDVIISISDIIKIKQINY